MRQNEKVCKRAKSRENFIAPFEIEWVLFTVNEQMKKIECAGGKETQKMNNTTQTD